jgi:hypothetical protein
LGLDFGKTGDEIKSQYENPTQKRKGTKLVFLYKLVLSVQAGGLIVQATWFRGISPLKCDIAEVISPANMPTGRATLVEGQRSRVQIYEQSYWLRAKNWTLGL